MYSNINTDNNNNQALDNDIYFKSILEKNVVIQPKMFIMGFDKAITVQLRDDVEGLCTMPGYIKPGSVKIVSRTKGYSVPGNFNGNIQYKVKYEAEVCNPPKDMIISCKVLDINKMGILAKAYPLEIIIIKELHQNKTDFSKIKVGDIIDIKVIEKKFVFKDKKIDVIGVLASDSAVELSEEDEKEQKEFTLPGITDNTKLLNDIIDSDTENEDTENEDTEDEDTDNENTDEDEDIYEDVEDISIEETSSDKVSSIADNLSSADEIAKMSMIS
jgi:DNA-directed RNA polymerase subunit E'/Rpb7